LGLAAESLREARQSLVELTLEARNLFLQAAQTPVKVLVNRGAQALIKVFATHSLSPPFRSRLVFVGNPFAAVRGRRRRLRPVRVVVLEPTRWKLPRRADYGGHAETCQASRPPGFNAGVFDLTRAAAL